MSVRDDRAQQEKKYQRVSVDRSHFPITLGGVNVAPTSPEVWPSGTSGTSRPRFCWNANVASSRLEAPRTRSDGTPTIHADECTGNGRVEASTSRKRLMVLNVGGRGKRPIPAPEGEEAGIADRDSGRCSRFRTFSATAAMIEMSAMFIWLRLRPRVWFVLNGGPEELPGDQHVRKVEARREKRTSSQNQASVALDEPGILAVTGV